MSGFAVGTYVGPAGVRRLSFEDGLAKLKGKDQKKLEHNTFLVKVDDETLGVKLHNTIVVYIFKSGIYQLDTGGWRTVTTKDRINRYGPASVHQSTNIWYIGEGIFEDGVRVDSEGKVLTPQRGVKETESKKRKLDKMVRKYIKGFGEHVIAVGMKTGASVQSEWKVGALAGVQPIAPGPGDCWACYFSYGKPVEETADPLQEPLGVQHLLEHMVDEAGPYYVPSLLWKAIVVNRHNNPLFIWQYIANEAKRGEYGFLDQTLTGYFRKRKPAMLELME